jgi:signal recognition particle receptor subunit beta
VRVAKVLVAGAGEAGKSTLIQALVPDAMNLAVRGRTIAMDHAMMQCNGCRLSIVGVPGQHRFGAVREILAEGARGIIWVHRSGYSTDTETTCLVRDLSNNDVPYLVLVNHVGLVCRPHGWACPEGLPAPTKIIECDLEAPGDTLSILRDEMQVLIGRPATLAGKGR